MDLIVRTVQIVAVIGIVSSALYYLLCLWSAAKFLRERKIGSQPEADQSAIPAPSGFQPVSILKPLKGTDPEMYASFRSHCLQDYPEYEIIFGVSDPDDPAVRCVKQLQGEFPNCRIRLMVCSRTLGANVKVSNLAQMLTGARYDRLIVNDSDIRVKPDYLRRVSAPLVDSKVGMVTCLYRGVASTTLGSRLEALGISTDFCPSVLAARQLEGGIRFGLGSTLAFRRSELEKIGGFTSFVDYLADDYELGKRIAGLGLTCESFRCCGRDVSAAVRPAGFCGASTAMGAWGSGCATRRLFRPDFHIRAFVGVAGSSCEPGRSLVLGSTGPHAGSSLRGWHNCRPGNLAGQ